MAAPIRFYKPLDDLNRAMKEVNTLFKKFNIPDKCGENWADKINEITQKVVDLKVDLKYRQGA